MPAVCLDVVEGEHAYRLEEELGAAEVILDCALEHLLLDHYLVVEVVGVCLLQGLHEVEEHLGQSFLQELLRNSPVVDHSEDVDGCRLEGVRVEEVGEILVGVEIAVLEEEEAVDGEVDDLPQRLAAGLERAEELQQERHLLTGQVDPEVEEEADQ